MLAATDDGTVWAWGDGKYGKLGECLFDCGFWFIFDQKLSVVCTTVLSNRTVTRLYFTDKLLDSL